MTALTTHETACDTTPEAGATVLVTGATGQTGQLVAAGLRARGIRVRAASRSASGEQAVRFDWDDPHSYRPAVEGASAVYLVTPQDPGFHAESLAAFMACATAAGIRRTVLLSGLSAGYGSAPMASRETPVRESGTDWTILRPGAFQQNFGQEPYLTALEEGELRLPLGPGPGPFLAPVDITDIAEVAVATLTTQGHSGMTYPLAGPRALSFPEILAIVSRESGRPVVVTDEPVESWAARMRSSGVPENALNWSLETFEAVRRGEYADLHDGVQRVLGRAPRDFSSYAKAAARSGTWSAKRRFSAVRPIR